MEELQVGDTVENNVFGKGEVVWVTQNGVGVRAKSSMVGMAWWVTLRKNVRKVSGVAGTATKVAQE